MRFLCGALGVLMFFGGVLLAATSAGMKTTVGDTHNIGLIGKQQADTTFYSAIAVAGAVLLAGAGVMDALRTNSRRAMEFAETEGKKETADRQAMLRRLDTLIANGQPHAGPARQATLKPDAAFDALVDAELQPPRSAPQPVRAKTQPPPPGLR